MSLLGIQMLLLTSWSPGPESSARLYLSSVRAPSPPLPFWRMLLHPSPMVPICTPSLVPPSPILPRLLWTFTPTLSQLPGASRACGPSFPQLQCTCRQTRMEPSHVAVIRLGTCKALASCTEQVDEGGQGEQLCQPQGDPWGNRIVSLCHAPQVGTPVRGVAQWSGQESDPV